MNGIDAIEQIFPEMIFLHHLLYITVGGTNQTYIRIDLFIRTHPHNLPALQGNQQFCL